MKIAGFSITRVKKDDVDIKDDKIEKIVPKEDTGGAYEVSGSSSVLFNIDPIFHNEADLITRYRNLSNQPEVSRAIDDIVNEAFVDDDEQESVAINLDKSELSKNVKNKIIDEFDEILQMLDFKNNGYELFKKWYVDGRLYFYKIIDSNKLDKGILELRYVDPRQIKKIREVVVEPRNNNTPNITTPNIKYKEYYIYSYNGFGSMKLRTDVAMIQNNDFTRLAKDTVSFVHSGLYDANDQYILSHLHQAMKPYNQLKLIEEALIIYRLSRAPERRIFNIEVGNMPKSKAEEFVQHQMHQQRSKVVYDPETGTLRTDKKYTSFIDDFWFAQRDGKGTKVDTLSGGQNLGEISDLDYFRKKFYESLNVPISRLETNAMFQTGRASELTHMDMKFNKFVKRLRKRFSGLFNDLLKTQLLLKGIITYEEWEQLQSDIIYDYVEDNQNTEFRKAEIMRERFSALRDLSEFQGQFVSKKWLYKNALNMTDEDIDIMEKEIEEEAEAARQKEIERQKQDDENNDDEENANNNFDSTFGKDEVDESMVQNSLFYK